MIKHTSAVAHIDNDHVNRNHVVPEFIDIDPSSLHVGIVTDLTRQAGYYNYYYKHSAKHITGPATVHAKGTKSIMLYNNTVIIPAWSTLIAMIKMIIIISLVDHLEL